MEIPPPLSRVVYINCTCTFAGNYIRRNQDTFAHPDANEVPHSLFFLQLSGNKQRQRHRFHGGYGDVLVLPDVETDLGRRSVSYGTL